MNAITPAKLIPPDQSTAARGMLPIEQTKLSTAISGPTITFSIATTQPGASLTKRLLKKSLPSRPMKPASRKPIPISFQSICQSPRKLSATSVQLEAESRRARMLWVSPSAWPCSCWCPASASWAWRRACSSSRGETKARSITDISTIITTPPTYSARVNCQPSRTQSTSPRSQTRLVEANCKATADAAEAPFWKRLLAIAIAA